MNTMASKTYCTVLALSSIIALPVYGDDNTGWGISAGLGVSKVKDVDGIETFDGNGFAFSIEGEYRFTPFIALGIGTFSLGEPNDTFNSVDTEIRVGGYGLFGRVIYPFADGVDLYGRVGGVTYHADLTPGGSTGLFGEDATEYGLGLDLGDLNNTGFRFEGRYFDGPRDESGAMVTIGVIHRF